MLLSWMGGHVKLKLFGKVNIFQLLLAVYLTYFITAGAQFATDHIHYLNAYLQSGNSILSDIAFSFTRRYDSEATGYEFGYAVLSYLSHQIKLAFPGFMFCLMLPVNWIIVNYAYKFKYPAISILFFTLSSVYFQEANLVRQVFAAGLFIFSLSYLEKNKILVYASMVFVMALFHTSALILLIFCIVPLALSKIPINKIEKIIFALWIISFAIALLKIEIPLQFLMANKSMDSMYGKYVEDNDLAGIHQSIDWLYNILFFFILANLRKAKFDIYSLMLVMGCICLNLAVPMSSFARLSIYFTALQPISYSKILLMDSKNTSYFKFAKAFYVLLLLNAVRNLFFRHIFYTGADFGDTMYSLSSFFE